MPMASVPFKHDIVKKWETPLTMSVVDMSGTRPCISAAVCEFGVHESKIMTGKLFCCSSLYCRNVCQRRNVVA